MKHIELLNEFRELIGQLQQSVDTAGAMQLYDTHKIAENVICGLLRELYGLSALRNLNADQTNYPSIDLADDMARVAIQVTGTSNIGKIKDTLNKFINHQLHKRYERLIIYILTKRQDNYSQEAINSVVKSEFSLCVDNDILDYRSLCNKAAQVLPANLQAAINILKSYLRGVPVGLADEDIDPPTQPSETLFTNLLQIYFPADLHIAQLNSDIMKGGRKSKWQHWRQIVREYNQDIGKTVPSAYTIHDGTLITFHDLEDRNSPYFHLVESGTQEVHSSHDYYRIDVNHENVFKSLLRFSLQQRLFLEYVSWYNKEKQFVFLPKEDNNDTRKEVWQGEKQAIRTVYERKYNKKDASKVFMQKHLAFSVDFLCFDQDWLMSITPSWFFSYGLNFEKANRYGHEYLSWIKRQENNRAVFNHFRFISAWLRAIDTEDLFSGEAKRVSFLSFGDEITQQGAPNLDESRWVPLPSVSENDDFLSLKLIKE